VTITIRTDSGHADDFTIYLDGQWAAAVPGCVGSGSCDTIATIMVFPGQHTICVDSHNAAGRSPQTCNTVTVGPDGAVIVLSAQHR